MDQLIKIIETVPVAVRPLIKYYEHNMVRILRGITEYIPWRRYGFDEVVDKYGFNEFGIGLSYNCDNMGKTLVHECGHIRYPHLSEKAIDGLTDIYWNDCLEVRKVAVKRVIYELGRKGI